jgi:hypothetical protein
MNFFTKIENNDLDSSIDKFDDINYKKSQNISPEDSQDFSDINQVIEINDLDIDSKNSYLKLENLDEYEETEFNLQNKNL